MALEALERIAELLADLPERLAALWESKDKDKDLVSLMADAEALASLETESGLPQPVTVENWPDWLANPPAQQAEAAPREEAEPPVALPVSWPSAVAADVAPESAPADPFFSEPDGPGLAPAAPWPESEAPELPAPAIGPAATTATRDASDTEIDSLFADLPDATDILTGRAGYFEDEDVSGSSSDTGLETSAPLAAPAPSADFEGFEPVGGPAPETPGAGGSELGRMVTLLERIAAAVESLQRVGAAAPAQESSPRGYGSRMASWTTQQQARDFDAEEGFPQGSPSVNVSSLAGLSGASSVARGLGSGYRKRSSLTSGGQRGQKTSLADAKVFNEPGGHS